jgi:hypothetical protein
MSDDRLHHRTHRLVRHPEVTRHRPQSLEPRAKQPPAIDPVRCVDLGPPERSARYPNVISIGAGDPDTRR